MSCIVIAEIGENHIGNMDFAKKMIEEAAKVGVDMVKFQSFKGDDVPDNDPEKEWFYKVEVSDAAHRQLKKVAKDNGVEFISAPFSLERAEFLCDGLGLRKVKVASSQIINAPMLSYLNKHADTIFLSTGMADYREIEEALNILKDVKSKYLLHCVSEYPVSSKDANILVMKTLFERFKLPVGYSDHTLGTLACITAVALGAKVIEKHFTLDKKMEGTDHILSADPKELKYMVSAIREIEALLGSGEKKLTKNESNGRDSMRSRFSKAQNSKVIK